MSEDVVVIQADRDAAAKLYRDCAWVLNPFEGDKHPVVQAFARHRTEAVAAAEGRLKRLEEAVSTIIGRCEALEDEASDQLATELPVHATGFFSGQKSTAKSLRRHLHDMTYQEKA